MIEFTDQLINSNNWYLTLS